MMSAAQGARVGGYLYVVVSEKKFLADGLPARLPVLDTGHCGQEKLPIAP